MVNRTNGHSRILSNTGFLLFEKVFTLAIAFITSVYVIRYLGPEKFGLLEYSTSLIALLLPVGKLGMHELALKDLVVADDEEKGKILGTVTFLVLISGFLLSLICYLILSIQGAERVIRVLVIVTSVKLLIQSTESYDLFFKSIISSKHSVLARSINQLVVSGLKMIGVVLGLNIIYFGATVVLGLLVQAIIWFLLYRKVSVTVIRWKFDITYAKSILKNSWPLLISGMALSIYMKIDQVMLHKMVSGEELGNYAVAVRLSELWYFVPMAFLSSVFPSVLKSRYNQEIYHSRLQGLYDFLLLIALCLAIPMTLWGDKLMNVLYGTEYILSGQVLTLHIWACVFGFSGLVRSKWLIMEGLQRFGMIFNIIGALINVALNVLLIPEMGVMGAAWATIFSMGISSFAMAVLVKKTRKAFQMQITSIIHVITIRPMLKLFRLLRRQNTNS